MQLLTLLPVLALLATPIVAREPVEARRALTRHKHVRAAQDAANNMQRREQLAAEKPRARKVKRGANGCRARGSSFAATSSTSVAPAASSAVASVPAASSAVTSAAAGGENYVTPTSAAAESSAMATSAPAATSSAASSGNNGGGSGPQGTSPGSKKAGASGDDSVALLGDAISWYWNYQPAPWGAPSSKIFVPTLWGNGHLGGFDADRLNAFKAINNNPAYVQGFYEPDCFPDMSSDIAAEAAAPTWNELVVPHRANGALLVSPGMCKQADETWLTPFQAAIGAENMWDITSVHINKLDMEGAKKVLDHHAQFGKPMWVTEFACVDDQNNFTPVEDQGQINQYINDMVDLLENDSRVAAYSMSEGQGLAYNWAMTRNGQLTESGRTYLNAISKY